MEIYAQFCRGSVSRNIFAVWLSRKTISLTRDLIKPMRRQYNENESK